MNTVSGRFGKQHRHSIHRFQARLCEVRGDAAGLRIELGCSPALPMERKDGALRSPVDRMAEQILKHRQNLRSRNSRLVPPCKSSAAPGGMRAVYFQFEHSHPADDKKSKYDSSCR